MMTTPMVTFQSFVPPQVCCAGRGRGDDDDTPSTRTRTRSHATCSDIVDVGARLGRAPGGMPPSERVAVTLDRQGGAQRNGLNKLQPSLSAPALLKRSTPWQLVAGRDSSMRGGISPVLRGGRARRRSVVGQPACAATTEASASAPCCEQDAPREAELVACDWAGDDPGRAAESSMRRRVEAPGAGERVRVRVDGTGGPPSNVDSRLDGAHGSVHGVAHDRPQPAPAVAQSGDSRVNLWGAHRRGLLQAAKAEEHPGAAQTQTLSPAPSGALGVGKVLGKMGQQAAASGELPAIGRSCRRIGGAARVRVDLARLDGSRETVAALELTRRHKEIAKRCYMQAVRPHALIAALPAPADEAVGEQDASPSSSSPTTAATTAITTTPSPTATSPTSPPAPRSQHASIAPSDAALSDAALSGSTTLARRVGRRDRLAEAEAEATEALRTTPFDDPSLLELRSAVRDAPHPHLHAFMAPHTRPRNVRATCALHARPRHTHPQHLIRPRIRPLALRGLALRGLALRGRDLARARP